MTPHPHTPSAAVHIYLAGPDVFFPNAIAIGETKKQAVRAHGFIPHFPFDNEIAFEQHPTPEAIAQAIGRANEDMMRHCADPRHIGVILANLCPFHGPSADVGTAFELGFMAALSYSHPSLWLYGYSHDQRQLKDRVATDYYGDPDALKADGDKLIGSDGCVVEHFGGLDNLMLTHAIARTGGSIYPTFEEALNAIAHRVSSNSAQGWDIGSAS